MASGPKGQGVDCPQCDSRTIAILPNDGEIVEQEEVADGKTWVNCHDCGERFLVHYLTGS